MARPTRKQSILGLFESPQAEQFKAAVAHIVGGPQLRITPLERLADIHVFRVEGDGDQGLLFEHSESSLPEGVWRSDVAFYNRHPTLPLQVWIELAGHGWDAHLAAEQSGDRSIVDLPPKRRAAVRDERSRSVGLARDWSNQTVFGTDSESPVWPSLPTDRLDRLWQAHCAALDSPRKGLIDPYHWDGPVEQEPVLLDDDAPHGPAAGEEANDAHR